MALENKYHTDNSWNTVNSKIQKPVISIKKFWVKAAVAASILIVLGTAIGLYFQFRDQEYTFASNNKVSKLTFPDNSIVWVNRNSKIFYKKDFKNHRHIKLYGEAYFSVSADTAHPFTIATNNALITVVGTKFNVKAYSTDTATEVTVKSGKVKLSSNNVNSPSKSEILILAGEKGISLDNSDAPIKLNSTDPNYMAWRTHDFTFNNTNIKDLVKLISETYNATIIIEGTNTENCNITGRYSCNSLDDMLDMLSIVLNISIEKKGETIIINTTEC
jgi:ferric-dicitrate binding protein FerR (iron transport regulator)